MISTAKSAGLILCLQCNKLNSATEQHQQCSRCNAVLFDRKPKSLQYTIAWTIAAMVMFIPANMLPIMVFSKLGNPEASTIMSGIVTFMKLGMYPVAAIVFVASFIVPLGKIIGLVVLVHGTQKAEKPQLEQRTKLYHIVEFLGPWSMLDVFVVSLMVGVVNLGFITSIEAGPGINYFALMVVFTMFAANSFDPRLLWDNHQDE